MTAVFLLTFVAVVFFAAPYVGAQFDRHRRHRDELDRVGRITYPTGAPRFDGPRRPDPSPTRKDAS